MFRKIYATQMFVFHDTKTKEMIAFDKKTLNYNNYFIVFPLDLRGWLMKRWRQPRVCHKRKPKEKKRENERSDRDIMAANGPFLLLQQRVSHFIFLLSSLSFSFFSAAAVWENEIFAQLIYKGSGRRGGGQKRDNK